MHLAARAGVACRSAGSAPARALLGGRMVAGTRPSARAAAPKGLDAACCSIPKDPPISTPPPPLAPACAPPRAPQLGLFRLGVLVGVASRDKRPARLQARRASRAGARSLGPPSGHWAAGGILCRPSRAPPFAALRSGSAALNEWFYQILRQRCSTYTSSRGSGHVTGYRCTFSRSKTRNLEYLCHNGTS